MTILLSFGIIKAILTYKGKSAAPTTFGLGLRNATGSRVSQSRPFTHDSQTPDLESRGTYCVSDDVKSILDRLVRRTRLKEMGMALPS